MYLWESKILRFISAVLGLFLAIPGVKCMFFFYCSFPGQGLALSTEAPPQPPLCSPALLITPQQRWGQNWVHAQPGISLLFLQEKPQSKCWFSFSFSLKPFLCLIMMLFLARTCLSFTDAFWAANEGATLQFLTLERWSSSRWQGQRQHRLGTLVTMETAQACQWCALAAGAALRL